MSKPDDKAKGYWSSTIDTNATEPRPLTPEETGKLCEMLMADAEAAFDNTRDPPVMFISGTVYKELKQRLAAKDDKKP